METVFVPQAPRGRVAPGTRLNGIYEVEQLIATGGMGEIYRGRAIETGDTVAIKTIRQDLAENDSALALFRKEASALHNLHHEAIVRYFVFSIDPALGCPYLAMEYVDGPSLSAVLKQGPVPFADLMVLKRRIAGGLHEAHERGIVHRDMSPDNVILPGGSPGRAKIIDFGIARSTALGAKTVIGSGFAGKFGYVSPEQLGLHGGDVTGKSDIYSFGLVLAEAATGRALDMGGTQVEVIEKRRTVPDLSAIDGRLRPLLERMLQPRPDDRPATMAEVAAWEPGAGRTAVATVQGVSKAAVSKPALAAGLAGVLLLSGAGAYLAGLFPATPPRTATPSTPAPPPLAAPGADLPSVTQGQGSLADRLVKDLEVPAISAPAPAQPPRQDPPLSLPVATPPKAPSAPPLLPTTPAPSPSTAMLSPNPASPPVQDDAERIRAYVARYAAGECIHLTPIAYSATSARIEGYGWDDAPFVAFDAAFKRDNGFEAQIALRLISRAQCPVADFLNRVGDGRPGDPKLELNPFNLRSGESLSGRVTGIRQPHAAIVLVSDDGMVHDLTGLAQRDGDALRFRLTLHADGPARGPRPQVVVVLASDRPIPRIVGRGAPAGEFFGPDSDATRSPLGVAVKYFRLEN
jgi:hypothetical protein